MNLHETTVTLTKQAASRSHQRREPLKMKEFSQQPSKATIKSREESLKTTRFSHRSGRFIANKHENRNIRFFLPVFNRKLIDFYQPRGKTVIAIKTY